MSEARTVTVHTLDHGAVTIPEPAWCLGEHTDGNHRQDIWHAGEEVQLLVPTPCHGPVPLMTAQVVQKPFATDADPHLAVLIDGEDHELTSVQVRDLADEVIALGMSQLHRLADRIEAIEGGA
ncbi:DUF6907 domain-containing protein [Streptomyces chartreusis]